MSRLPAYFPRPVVIGLIASSIAVLLAVACGGGEEPTAAATTAPIAQTATSVPAPAATATTAPVATAAPTRPAQPAATPTSAPSGPRGTVVGVTGGLGVGTPSGWPTDCLWCASIVMVSVQDTLWALKRDASGGLEMVSDLATSWTNAPDGSYTDVKLRTGVQFHQGFGELTADDIVYTYRAGIPSYTAEARHDTLPIPALKAVDAIDKNTVRLTWSAFNGLTLLENFAGYGEPIGIFSKKAADEKGVEWMREHVVGSGPFEMVEWTAQKVIDIKAFPNHWRKTPNIERFKLLEIPEDATRRAMLETGEAQMGDLPLKDWNPLLAKGFKKSNEGIVNGIEIIFGGQYWSEKAYETGAALNRQLDTSKPWIGNPFAPDCNQDDLLNNAKPTGPVCPSMKKPRDLRWALATDIDRDALVDSLTEKLGGPLYIRTHPDDPISKKNPDRWPVPFDPVQAKKFATDAGYASGTPQPITWWVGPAGLEVEVSEAVAAQWLTDLNIKVEFDRRVYSAQRPAMVDRTSNWLQTRNCCNPGTRLFAEEWIFSSAVPTGYNHAQELPFGSKIYFDKIKEPDLQKIEDLTVQFIDHHWYWMIDIGIMAVPSTTLYNGNVIASWDQIPYSATRLGGMRNGLETIKLK